MSDKMLFNILSTIFFILAILHTFSVSLINKQAKKYKEGTFKENFFHLFGEVEIVFGFWSAVFILFSISLINFEFTNQYLNSRNFTEALFVFVVMTICTTKPIIFFSESLLIKLSKYTPFDPKISTFYSLFFIAPLLGSFITEPAAMSICATLILPKYFTKNHSEKFKYALLALLFLNVSIGGSLTPFAAPPILMVAKKWKWNWNYMLNHFATPTILATFINSSVIFIFFKKEILKTNLIKQNQNHSSPLIISIIHFIFLTLIVGLSHYPILFLGLFLFFIGFVTATKEFQNALNLKGPLLVAFFIAGLIVIGGPQEWWLNKIINSFNSIKLFFGSIFFTAITDNAALTYLGSLIPNLESQSKLVLVKGSIIGGGLTIIANSPNPLGFGILKTAFENETLSSIKLFYYSIPLTIITILIFYYL